MRTWAPANGQCLTHARARTHWLAAALPRPDRVVIVRRVLLGILSDTHGRRDASKAGIELLRARGAKYLIHCGDVGGEDILDLLAGDDPPSAFVWGNNDF